MRKYVADGLRMKNENVCLLTTKKCRIKKLCKDCNYYQDFKLSGLKLKSYRDKIIEENNILIKEIK